MRVLLITDLPISTPFCDASACEYAATLAPSEFTEARARAHAPEIVVATLRAPNAAIFKELSLFNTPTGLPVIYVDHATDHRAAIAHLAAEAGVTAYIPAAQPIADSQSLLRWAQMRFQSIQKMQKKLADTEKKLADRIVIERAKGLMMQIQGIGEETAYREMRSQSMRHAVSMRVTAQSILDACGHTPGR
ncbi:MAG: ANTAR domain-containing protein [Alphaproteobacteria bacterium]|nr:ANTAR domain-containing protein [Alphaproteobacteria bacterium]